MPLARTRSARRPGATTRLHRADRDDIATAGGAAPQPVAVRGTDGPARRDGPRGGPERAGAAQADAGAGRAALSGVRSPARPRRRTTPGAVSSGRQIAGPRGRGRRARWPPGQIRHELRLGRASRSKSSTSGRGVPVGVGARVEEGTLPAPPLGDAHDLAIALEHLSRAPAREAHQGPMRPGLGPARRAPQHGHRRRPGRARALHQAPTHAAAAATSASHSGSSRGIHASIQRWSPGRSSTAPPPPRRRDHLHARRRRPPPRRRHRQRCVLPSTSVGWLDLAAHGVPAGAGPGRLDVEQRGRCESDGSDGSTGRRVGTGPRQEAAARYGSHKGSTSERCRSRHRYPSGGAGFTRSVQPNSERSWSALVRLSRLQAATTLDQSWVPPRLRGNDVVDGVGRLGAVDAETAVPSQHRASGHRRGPRPAGDPHHVGQADDGGHIHVERGRVEDGAVLAEGHRLGPPGQDQDDGTTIGDKGERLIGRIEKEHPLHRHTTAAGVAVGTPRRSPGLGRAAQLDVGSSHQRSHNAERLPAAGACPPTPSEVGHHVARRHRRRPVPRPAERRDQSEVPNRTSPGTGRNGRTVPPAASGPCGRPRRGRPTRRMDGPRPPTRTTATSRPRRRRCAAARVDGPPAARRGLDVGSPLSPSSPAPSDTIRPRPEGPGRPALPGRRGRPGRSRARTAGPPRAARPRRTAHRTRGPPSRSRRPRGDRAG